MSINAIRIFSGATMALEKMRRLPAIRNGRLVEAVSRGYIRKVVLIYEPAPSAVWSGYVEQVEIY